MIVRCAGYLLLAMLSASLAHSDERAGDDRIAPSVQTIAEGLEHPWSLAFLPDGRLLVSERAGRLNIIEPDGSIEPITGVPEVLAESQGGLMDVVLHPDYEQNAWVYLTYAHGTQARNATRLARARLQGRRLVDLQIVFTARPWKDTPVHYGGRLTFLPDRTLLMTVGDGFDYREEAQRLDNHLGKIVRLADDGRVPMDNPFLETPDALPEIWSYGHRNPQGIAYDALNDRVISHEHGPAGGDEINVIVPGGNYGWPVATHGKDYSGARISPWTRYDGMQDPRVDWTPSIAPAGLAIAHDEHFVALQGRVLVSTLKSRELLSVHLPTDGEPVQQQRLTSGHGRLRDVRAAADGSVWLLTDSPDGAVLRLDWAPE